MKLQKCIARDAKIAKRKHGMRISGASVKLIQEEIRKKAEAARKEREEKESVINKLLKDWIEEDA